MFLEWLIDQRLDEESKYFGLAEIIWADIHSGCLQPVKSVVDLQEHFRERHTHIAYRTATLLAEAFGAYTDRFNKK